MGSEEDYLYDALLSGVDVSKRLAVVCPEFPRNIETLIALAEGALSTTGPFKIIFHPRVFEGKVFLGNIRAFGDHADIFYDLDRSLCWRRFIIAKEMSHLLFAPEGHAHLISTPEQIEGLIDKLMAGMSPSDLFNEAYSTESSTICMALEILMPHRERSMVNAMLEDGQSHGDVATKYRVPLPMVKLFLNPGYSGAMDAAYRMAEGK